MSRREQLVLGGAVLGATVLNVCVYPFRLAWEPNSAAFFSICIALTAWLLYRAWSGDQRLAAGTHEQP